MPNDEYYTPMVWKIVSIIILFVGILIGLILFISDQRLFAFLFVFIGIVGFLPLLAISQVFKWLLILPQERAAEEQVASQESQPRVNQEKNWVLNQAEKQVLLDYYKRKGQTVDEILVSPVHYVVAVIVDGNLDVMRLNGSEVELLTKKDVEAIPELVKWIEEDVLEPES